MNYSQPGTCAHREGGGRWCENVSPSHSDDEHWFSRHTILHDRLGNGYSCESIEAFLDSPPEAEPVRIHTVTLR